MRSRLDADGRSVVKETVRDQVRLRIPRVLALYQGQVRPRITGERRHIVTAEWARQGVELVRESGACAVHFDAGGAWFEDPSGFQWYYQGGLSGTGTWAEHGKEYEREETRLMADLLPPGGTMIDIGANVGLHCIKLARTVQGLRVLACEPVEETLACLQRNMRRNGIGDQIEIHRVALTDHAGEIRITSTLQITNFVVPDGSPASGHATTTVPCARLDDLLSDRADRVDLIKCDVEGAELEVLRGASSTLRRFRPPIFVEVVERYARRYGHEPDAVFAFLADHGYRHELVVDGRRTPTTGSLDGDLAATPNFLFVGRD